MRTATAHLRTSLGDRRSFAASTHTSTSEVAVCCCVGATLVVCWFVWLLSQLLTTACGGHQPASSSPENLSPPPPPALLLLLRPVAPRLTPPPLLPQSSCIAHSLEVESSDNNKLRRFIVHQRCGNTTTANGTAAAAGTRCGDTADLSPTIASATAGRAVDFAGACCRNSVRVATHRLLQNDGRCIPQWCD